MPAIDFFQCSPTANGIGIILCLIFLRDSNNQTIRGTSGGRLKRSFIPIFAFAFCLSAASNGWASDSIPKTAWKRAFGLPLENSGITRVPGDIDDGYWQGVPIGGIGAGTFSRSYRGEFARWHIKAANHKYEPVDANQFAMFQQSEGDGQGTAQVLMNGHPQDSSLASWQWDYPVGAGDYYALFPKAWFDYKWNKFPAHVVLEQFSPVIPNKYRESSYPVAVYRLHAENRTNKKVTVSVLLSWTNMSGWFRTITRDFTGAPNQGNHNYSMNENIAGAGTMKGIVFDRNRAGGAPNEWDGQFAIAALDSPGVEVRKQTTFQASGDGKAVWTPFSKNGRLANDGKSWVSDKEKLAGAIAVRFTLRPGETKVIPMVIARDFPLVQFGEGRKWNRRYTDFYGTSGRNAWKIARDGLLHATQWSDEIDQWQAPYINDASKPQWYRGMLFNELYALTNGGTFWGRQAGSDLKAPPTFAELECFDYAYYGTLDVRFYASLPLLKFWPDIDKQVLLEFTNTVPKEWPEQGLWVWKAAQTGQPVTHKRKKIGAVPHDMQVSAMKKIFDVNVTKFGHGEMGAANGMSADGAILTNAEAKEVWVGTTEGFAGLLMSEGQKDEAWKATWGLYHVIYESKGYWFRTPEAWDITGNFRAGMYMRPMAIWALEMTPARPRGPERDSTRTGAPPRDVTR